MGTTIRVLIVDEDQDVLGLTEAFLERESDAIAVETEQGAQRALDRIETGEIDCVVSDYRMPEMDGLELFEAVRERDPDVPFLLFSAAADQETVEKASEAGVTEFIQKGSGTDHFNEMIDQIEAAVEG
jgi:DNA-binding NtrC family response regulator